MPKDPSILLPLTNKLLETYVPDVLAHVPVVVEIDEDFPEMNEDVVEIDQSRLDDENVIG